MKNPSRLPAYEDGTDSVPKRQHVKFGHRENYPRRKHTTKDRIHRISIHNTDSDSTTHCQNSLYHSTRSPFVTLLTRCAQSVGWSSYRQTSVVHRITFSFSDCLFYLCYRTSNLPIYSTAPKPVCYCGPHQLQFMAVKHGSLKKVYTETLNIWEENTEKNIWAN